jgi:riboflavin synthase
MAAVRPEGQRGGGALMFTGIVESTGVVLSASAGHESGRLVIATPLEGLRIGESVAVNGVCLTATAVSAGEFSADVVETTLRRTNLGALQSGARVNIESPLRLGDSLDGHLVQGHVEETGEVTDIRDSPSGRRVRVAVSKELIRGIIPRGSIAVDGVSLTVADLGDDWFEVALIPHTLSVTVAGGYALGTRVNLEPDMIGRYVARLMPQADVVAPSSGGG